LTGRSFDFFERYKLDDAETALVVLGSTAGTAKDVVDELREQGKRVGLLKVRVFRPFMWDQVTEALASVNTVGVMDRSASFGGFGGPVFTEIRSAFHEHEKRPKIINYIYGLGGREMNKNLLHQAFQELEYVKNTSDLGYKVRCLGVREQDG
jgi:pyruvate ferredoxin oxidoreductase alpha subunit